MNSTGAVTSPFLSSVLTFGRRNRRFVGVAIAVVVVLVVFFVVVVVFLVSTIEDQYCSSLLLWYSRSVLSRVSNVSSAVEDVVEDQAGVMK